MCSENLVCDELPCHHTRDAESESDEKVTADSVSCCDERSCNADEEADDECDSLDVVEKSHCVPPVSGACLADSSSITQSHSHANPIFKIFHAPSSRL